MEINEVMLAAINSSAGEVSYFSLAWKPLQRDALFHSKPGANYGASTLPSNEPVESDNLASIGGFLIPDELGR
jgi:hypothetical protein